MRLLALLLGSLLGVWPPTSTSAGTLHPAEGPPPDPKTAPNRNDDDQLPETTTGDDFRVGTGGGNIEVEVTQPGSSRRRGATTVTNGRAPVCTHEPATYGDYPNVVPPEGIGVPDPDLQVVSDAGDRPARGWFRRCGTSERAFYWAAPDIDPVDLVPDALARATAGLPTPSPDINPDPEAGGIVNLGIWLAVDDPGNTTARADLANVWAQVTASVSGIAIDLGNGDVITCDGLGTPIPDGALDSLDEGPCGYTYRTSSPDDAPFQMTISTVYDVTWRTSSGRTGTLADVRRSTTFDYDVDEIQTVGVSN